MAKSERATFYLHNYSAWEAIICDEGKYIQSQSNREMNKKYLFQHPKFVRGVFYFKPKCDAQCISSDLDYARNVNYNDQRINSKLEAFETSAHESDFILGCDHFNRALESF